MDSFFVAKVFIVVFNFPVFTISFDDAHKKIYFITVFPIFLLMQLSYICENQYIFKKSHENKNNTDTKF